MCVSGPGARWRQFQLAFPEGSLLGLTTDLPWEINFLIQCHSSPTSKTKIKSPLDQGYQKVWGWKMLN